MLPSIFSKNVNFLSKIGEKLSNFMKKLEKFNFFTLLKTRKLSYFHLGFLRSLRNSQFFRQKCLISFFGYFVPFMLFLNFLNRGNIEFSVCLISPFEVLTSCMCWRHWLPIWLMLPKFLSWPSGPQPPSYSVSRHLAAAKANTFCRCLRRTVALHNKGRPWQEIQSN